MATETLTNVWKKNVYNKTRYFLLTAVDSFYTVTNIWQFLKISLHILISVAFVIKLSKEIWISFRDRIQLQEGRAFYVERGKKYKKVCPKLPS